jgi:hypothetical protein
MALILSHYFPNTFIGFIFAHKTIIPIGTNEDIFCVNDKKKKIPCKPVWTINGTYWPPTYKIQRDQKALSGWFDLITVSMIPSALPASSTCVTKAVLSFTLIRLTIQRGQWLSLDPPMHRGPGLCSILCQKSQAQRFHGISQSKNYKYIPHALRHEDKKEMWDTEAKKLESD